VETFYYGLIHRAWHFNDQIVFVADADEIKRILHTEFENYDRSTLELKLFSELLGGGLIFQKNGPGWKEMRTTMTPAFTRQAIRQKIPLFVERTKILIEKLNRHQGPIEIQDEFQRLTFDLICLTTLAFDPQSQRQQHSIYGQAWNTILTHMLWKLFCPIEYWKVYKTKWIQKYEESMKIMNDTIYNLIKEDKADDDSLLGILMKKRKDGSKLTDGDIRNELLTFLFAGHDTTTNLLTWSLYFLSQHPTVLKKAQEEVDLVLQKKPPAADNYHKLQYLKCVIKETMRLRPSAPSRGRELAVDDTIGGIKVKKGTMIAWSSYVIQHLPQYWKNVEDFDPDRFSDTSSHHPFAYIPFGAGPRKCIGEHMAMGEVLVVISMLIQQYTFKIVPGHPVIDEVILTMRAGKGLKMFFYPRN